MMKMSDDPISKVYCVGNSKAIIRARWDNLYTFELEYPRFIHSEFMTHRMFSRNASSSRAVPVERTIQNILNDPWVPSDVYKNCKGMQGKDIVNEDDYDIFCEEWQDAAFKAIEVAHKMIDNGFHKQHINRILEPFTKIKVIVTATEWNNFFDLRLSPDADPEIQHLAKAIKMAMNAVSNTYIYINAHGGRTLPYVNFDEMDAIDDLRILTLISAARCARVSYLNHDGSKPDILKDLTLAKRLIDSGHMTPFEHQCRCLLDTGFQYNLRDFQSARYMLDHGIDLSAP
jgi:thymidylate synthase ThyX